MIISSKINEHNEYHNPKTNYWASACQVSLCEHLHDRSQFQVAPMPAPRYVEENGLAAILTTKRSAGVLPEVNPRKYVTCMPLPRANKAAHSGFEIQIDVTRSPKQGYQWPHKKDSWCSPIFFKKFRKKCQTVS